MKTQFQYNMMDAVFKAKLFIESLYPEFIDPHWFYTRPHHSFSDERNTIEFYVFEGSPPRGFIIANYARSIVTAFDMHMKMIMITSVSGLEWPKG